MNVRKIQEGRNWEVRINRQEVESLDRERKPRSPYRVAVHMSGFRKDGNDWLKDCFSEADADAACVKLNSIFA